MKNPTVLLVAGHSVVRLGLRMLLADRPTTVVGETSNAAEGETLAATLQPDIIVLDASLPDADEIGALERMASAHPPGRIIFLSGRDDEEFVERALVSGASAYLLKETATADLKWAVQAAEKGHEYFSPALIQRLRDPAATIPEPDQLQDLSGTAASRIEARLITFLNQGLVIRQLAQELRDNIESIRRDQPARASSRRRAKLPGWNVAKALTAMFRGPQGARNGAI